MSDDGRHAAHSLYYAYAWTNPYLHTLFRKGGVATRRIDSNVMTIDKHGRCTIAVMKPDAYEAVIGRIESRALDERPAPSPLRRGVHRVLHGRVRRELAETWDAAWNELLLDEQRYPFVLGEQPALACV